MAEALVVADDMVVSLDYTLRLDDGEIVDTSDGRGPLQFLQGRGQIIPGLEQALYDLAIGDEKDVEVAPADGYGVRDPEAMQVVSRDAFPPDVDPQPGMGFRMRDEVGRAVVVYVAAVRPEEILLDLNHPLAGETLSFHVKIVDLWQATEADLAPSCGSSCCGCASQEACD